MVFINTTHKTQSTEYYKADISKYMYHFPSTITDTTSLHQL